MSSELRTWSGALLMVAATAHGGRLAQSVVEFSGTQGSGGWRYGLLQDADADADADAGQPPAYGLAAFQEFDVFNQDAGTWRASDALVGSQNTRFLSLNAAGGHPCGLGPSGQDRIIWPTRRYTTAEPSVSVAYQFESRNSFEPKGRGFTARVFVDGGAASSFLVRDAFDTVRVPPLVILGAGTVIDFAVDPLGVEPFGADSPHSARSDGFSFTAGVYPFPCSSDADCEDIPCVDSVCCDSSVHLCSTDAGPPEALPAERRRLRVGCDCSTATAAAPSLLCLTLVLSARRRRTRVQVTASGEGAAAAAPCRARQT
jgi:hypothetical protein